MTQRVLQKSMAFAVRIVQLSNFVSTEKKERVLSKQILRSGTSIGANLREARYAQSTDDFIRKASIALKEVSETEYWLELLYRTDYLTAEQYESIQADCSELAKMLTAIVKTTKKNRSKSSYHNLLQTRVNCYLLTVN